MRPASLDWRIEKYSRGYVRSIAFACFYHAERVLFVKAKFLVHLLGEGEGRVKQEREEVGDESWERTGGYGGAGNGNARKKYPQNVKDLALGMPLGGYRPVSYILRKLCSWAHFPRR